MAIGNTSRPGMAGFTLLELVVATTIAATLMVSLGAVSRMFGTQIEAVREQQEQDLDRAVTEITEAGRQAWSVQLASSTEVTVTDALGRETRYWLDAKTLKVRRPSGAIGTLVDDVASAAFQVETVQRLRDTAPVDSYGTVWSSPVPPGTPDTLEVRAGQTLAIGFQAPAAAPSSFQTVTGVVEEMIHATLDRIVLPASHLDGSPMEFCHLHAPGPPHNPSHKGSTGLMTVTLHEAKVPGDARPHGPALASTTVPTAALPAATWTWWVYHLDDPVLAPEVIDPPAGVAWGWWEGNPQVQLEVDAPLVEVPVDLGGLGAVIEPSRAYTLLIEVSGYDHVSVRTIPTASAELSGVAFRSSPGGSFAPQPVRVMASIEGLRSYTQTDASDVVRRLTLDLSTADGASLTGSAVVDGQIAAPDPWLGSVPGQSAGLVSTAP